MTTLAFRHFGLRPAQLKELDRKAKNEGKSTVEYVRLLIERDLRADKSFDEILKPIREGFRKNGVGEEEFDQLVTEARRSIHRKSRQGKQK
jgi:hypothetical protein